MSELRVALTFDAEHPSRAGNRSDAAEAILDALGTAGVRATFFVQGRWATAFPDVARRIAADGHLIGNHSNYHARMTMLSLAGVARDVAEAEDRIATVTGADPRPWFRCPFGDGVDRPEILDALASRGYRDVGYDVDTLDWHPDASPASVVDAVARGVASRADGPVVVLQHSWPAATAEAVPRLLRRLVAEGASFPTIAELDRVV